MIKSRGNSGISGAMQIPRVCDSQLKHLDNAGLYNSGKIYFKKKDEDQLISFSYHPLFKKDFIKGIEFYLKDCPDLVERVKNKEFKRRHIITVLKEYNNACAD